MPQQAYQVDFARKLVLGVPEPTTHFEAQAAPKARLSPIPSCSNAVPAWLVHCEALSARGYKARIQVQLAIQGFRAGNFFQYR